jgi:hypothetical protein
MWLATVFGWFSVVTDLKREDRMLIRARCRADIFNLFDANQDLPSIERPTSDESRDYRWRMSVSRADWLNLAGRLAASIDYSNFKNAVHDQPDQVSKGRPYLAIWRVMHEVQVAEGPPKPPKQKRSRRRKNDPMYIEIEPRPNAVLLAQLRKDGIA